MSKNIESFSDFKLNRQILNAVEDAGFESPTPVQLKVVPLALAGHDVLGIAQTGTGKTAAYLLPIIMKLKYAQGDAPRTLIVPPTRELVLQVERQAMELAKYTDLRIAAIYGGVGAKDQLETLQNGVDILVATPGRFIDLYRKGALHTKTINTLVLDEADKMMDMGFMPQIRQILEKIPSKRQNLLFSATFPAKVEKLSEEFLTFPERVEITPQATRASTVSHYYYKVPNLQTRARLLQYLLKDESFEKVMIFVRTKDLANQVFNFIERKIEGGVRVVHSNKAQRSRINAIRDFEAGEIRVLVTTDVTARGHDIKGVSHVINYGAPLVYEDYVHRIGRTGRAFQSGEAITFADEADLLHLMQIEKIIREKIPEKPMPGVIEIAETPFNEKQQIAREIDHFKRKEGPDYKGAFHEKKPRPIKKSSKSGVKKHKRRRK
ncbi:MAG TPA: DEAD/DEAH box helicase [Cytophagales bacterium]|jgi:ATP-dependent RNA helicase RhlE|nr:DEAD/DEAH box helicase [Cytophagales bacterium]